MAITRTYVVGMFGMAKRMDEHDPLTVTDINPTNSNLTSTPTINPLTGVQYGLPSQSGAPTPSAMGWYTHLVDVKTNPLDAGRVCVISGVKPTQDVSPWAAVNPLALHPTSPEPGMGSIFMSYNAGATWLVPGGNWIDLCNTTTGTVGNMFQIWYTDNHTIYIIAEGGVIFKSTDEGLTFNYIEDNLNNPVQVGFGHEWTTAIHMWKDTTNINGGLDYGVVVQKADNFDACSDVTVWKTIDAGHTWQQLNSGNPLTDTLTPGTGSDAAIGIYMSQNQTIITVTCSAFTNRSVDGGATFHTTIETWSTNGPAYPDPVGCPPAASPFTGPVGTIVKLTWVDTYGSFSMDQMLIGAINPGPGTMGIGSTQDGGTTWSTMSGHGSFPYYGAHFHSPSNGYVSRGMNVFETIDGGVTFNIIF